MATKYYLYEERTGLYLYSTDEKPPSYLRDVGIGYTTIPIPDSLFEKVDKYHRIAFDRWDSKWILLPYFIGTWYNKETKEKLVVDRPGIEVDLSKYTDKEPCEFCIWNEEKNDWVFSLDLYKKHAIETILNKFYDYFLKREPLIHQTALTGIMVRTLTILSTNKSLTEKQIEYLSNVIQECESAFIWISKVTEYELQLEEQVKKATTKEEVDKVLSSIDFSKFDKSYRYVTIGDKITEISRITLTGRGSEDGE